VQELRFGPMIVEISLFHSLTPVGAAPNLNECKRLVTTIEPLRDNGGMKNRRDCNCPCHSGGVVVHPVPCCDGILGYLKRKPKSDAKPKKSTANEK
jgi:hypothetical protein